MTPEMWWAIGIRCGLFVVWVLLAMVSGRHAEAKGYSFAAGFTLSFAASPLAAWAALHLLPDRPPRVSPQLQLQIELEQARMRAAKKKQETLELEQEKRGNL